MQNTCQHVRHGAVDGRRGVWAAIGLQYYTKKYCSLRHKTPQLAGWVGYTGAHPWTQFQFLVVEIDVVVMVFPNKNLVIPHSDSFRSPPPPKKNKKLNKNVAYLTPALFQHDTLFWTPKTFACDTS